MQNNLRQHITSMVKDIIPLGRPLHHRDDDRGRSRPVPQCSSQETNKKHAHTLKPLNPFSQCIPPHKSVLERKNRAAVELPSDAKKTFAGDQESLSNYNASMRKVLFNNNNDNHINNERSCQSTGKKDAPLQRQGSYVKEREFALAFFKQLNENLKVGKPVAQSGNTPHKMPSVQPLISSNISESHKASAPPNSQRTQNFERGVNQQSQQSVEKMDKPADWDHSSFTLSQGERVQHQATVPGDKSLSLKRRRESNEERHGESKRLCQDGVELYSLSSSSSNSSSPPKFIKRAFLKEFDGPVLTLKEKCSPKLNICTEDRIKTSNNVAKPWTESHKLQTATPMTTGHGTGYKKEEMRRSTENKCLRGNSATADNCASHTSKKQEEGGSPVSSHTSSLLAFTDRLEISFPIQQSDITSPSSLDGTDSHNSKTITRDRKDVDLVWHDPLDLELGEDEWLDTCVLSLSSSHSSEEDQLLPLKDIFARSTRVPVTPEKMTFSEPSTPDLKVVPEDCKNKATSYKNTLEQMLKEKEQNRKSKEREMQLLQACKEDLLKLEEEDENEEEELSHEQREFLQRFSVTSCVIRDIHPGEEVFTLANSGRLFNHHSLDLRKTGITPNNRAQKTLLQAPLEQLLPLLSAGLFRRAYSSSPCQPQVTCWLFQMMSVHPNPIVCAQILQALTSIALSSAQQIVEKSNKKFEVWVPTIQDVALVFLNMGASFVSLFPLEALQPSFTEGDLLESLEIQPDVTRSENERDTFPEHNFENIIKYMALCAALCPKVYSDEELLLMLTVVCRVSLETRLQLLPTGDLSCLLQHLLNNMTQWEIQLPQVCQAFTNLSEDHHNLRRLVQLLPHSVRGKQLRRHVSLSVISKLLNHRCTYTPSCTEFQLSDLRCYLPRMRPSSLLKGLMAANTTEPQDTDDCATTPDQQAYYLCYSLLALTNEASNFEFLPQNQRNELLLLCAELEKHVKCDIRESEKMLYRSKVKDFVARIYTKWQVLLKRSRSNEGYDFWKPLPENEKPIKNKSQFSKLEDTEESLSEESAIVQSHEEDCMEENEDVPMESEEQLEDIDELIQDKIETLQGVFSEMKENQSSLSLDEKDADEMKDFNAIDELLGGSSEGSVESDEDEDLIKREEELLKDDESLERNGYLEGGENELEFDTLEKTNKELILDE
ncbi:SMC5-SMC6 complex localization factor protein 2 isoform X2 [Tachysurus vachellii]|uniref:SMC5-SMC6 complex localization factor protein 2 isoform X2 n=1 Tax=Tachysurus vachellii TaxID=175792 RepID=UPI00296B2E5B|nr:SMC5-SMC6 complex localization factor protein 2 isoform X2 [Tachysurus vachellii]